jgi:hypothetical protein
MTLYGIVQEAIIGAAVIASGMVMLRKLLPNWVRSRQLALATIMSHPSRSFVFRSLARFVRPGTASSGGCGSGCSSCSSCASNPDAGEAVKPLTFQRHI